MDDAVEKHVLPLLFKSDRTTTIIGEALQWTNYGLGQTYGAFLHLPYIVGIRWSSHISP